MRNCRCTPCMCWLSISSGRVLYCVIFLVYPFRLVQPQCAHHCFLSISRHGHTSCIQYLRLQKIGTVCMNFLKHNISQNAKPFHNYKVSSRISQIRDVEFIKKYFIYVAYSMVILWKNMEEKH